MKTFYRYPSRIHVDSLKEWTCQARLSDGRWVAARPLGFASLLERIALAWAVFAGKADALFWEGQ